MSEQDINVPIDLYDNGWLVVKGADPEELVEEIGLFQPKQVTMQQGFNAVVVDFWDYEFASDNGFAHNSRVFITPQIDGWCFVIGGWVSLGADLRIMSFSEQRKYEANGFDSHGHRKGYVPLSNVEAIKNLCVKLSRKYGQAHAFVTQGRMDWYGWLLSNSGNIDRCFVWSGRVDVDEGSWSPTEARLRIELLDEPDEPWEEQVFGEDVIMEIARENSVSPKDWHSGNILRINPKDKGILAITEYGLKSGVPTRSLGDDL